MSTAPASAPLVPSGPALHAAVGELTAAAARVRDLLAAGSLDRLSEAAIAQATVALAAVTESAAAATSTGLARVAGCGYPASEGFVTAASWWRARTRVSQDTASAQVRLARRLGGTTGRPRRRGRAGRSPPTREGPGTGVDAVLARLARRYRRDHDRAGSPVDRGASSPPTSASPGRRWRPSCWPWPGAGPRRPCGSRWPGPGTSPTPTGPASRHEGRRRGQPADRGSRGRRGDQRAGHPRGRRDGPRDPGPLPRHPLPPRRQDDTAGTGADDATDWTR